MIEKLDERNHVLSERIAYMKIQLTNIEIIIKKNEIESNIYIYINIYIYMIEFLKFLIFLRMMNYSVYSYFKM